MAASGFNLRAAGAEKRGVACNELLLDGAVVADVDVFTKSPTSLAGRSIAKAVEWLVGDVGVPARVCGVSTFTALPPAKPAPGALPAHVVAAAGLDLDARIHVLGLHLGGRCLLIHRAAGVFNAPSVRRLLQGGIEGVRVAGANIHLVGLSMHLDAAFGTPSLMLHGARDSPDARGAAPAAQRRRARRGHAAADA